MGNADRLNLALHRTIPRYGATASRSGCRRAAPQRARHEPRAYLHPRVRTASAGGEAAEGAWATMVKLFDDTDADKSGSIDEAELTVLVRFPARHKEKSVSYRLHVMTAAGPQAIL